MSNDLVSPDIAKSAEGKFLKLEPDTPTEFILHKPIEIIDAEKGDNLQYFRKVNIGGKERHIKYVIFLKAIEDGTIKEWQIGSSGPVNQLQTINAKVGDVISIEKVKFGERKQDVRYKIKLTSQGSSTPEQMDDEPPTPEEEIPM